MIKELCELGGFCTDDSQYLEDCLLKIFSDTECLEKFIKASDDYFDKGECYLDLLSEVSAKMGIHEYTVHLVFLLYCAKSLRNTYIFNGYDEDMYLCILHDLCCKTEECKTLYGICGTFVFRRWFGRFFKGTLFGFGRLELGMVAFPHEEYNRVKKGDASFDCHIPSGGKLLMEDVYASLKKAYRFFKEKGILKGDIMTVNCHSWILYPETVKVFAPESNLRKFAELFDVLRTEENPGNDDFWRIFGVEYDENFEKAPQDTSLRRNLVAYLKNGGNLGSGIGVLQFDGEKVINVTKNN